MEALDPWGRTSLDPRGLIGKIYVREHYILNISCGSHGSRKKKISFFPYFFYPWGLANLDPRGLIGWIYVGNNLTLLHTNNIC